jgi:hypothetical protein
LTVDIAVRGSGFHIAREVHTKFASPRNPISRVPKEKIAEKTVGRELLRELEELKLFGPRVGEGPGGATVLVEGQGVVTFLLLF